MRPHVTRFEYLQEAIKHPPVNESICMEWPYAASVLGYGYLRSPWGYRLAHRIAYILHYGPLLPGRWCVCHRCDNPKCFRPSHLFLGTQADNIHDGVSKGRYPSQQGGAYHRSKFTEAQVREMNSLYLAGKIQARIAEQFGISTQEMSYIVNKKRWAHLTDLSWKR